MGNYIDNDELEVELKKWMDSSPDIEKRVPSERLGQIMLDLHDGILTHQNFRGYRQELKDEMKSYSLFRIFKCGIKSWKPDKGCKAFSYFTRAVFQNYISVLGKYYSRINNHREYVRNELMNMDTKGDVKLEQFLRELGLYDMDAAHERDRESRL